LIACKKNTNSTPPPSPRKSSKKRTSRGYSRQKA
jgi:hypothetical protein